MTATVLEKAMRAELETLHELYRQTLVIMERIEGFRAAHATRVKELEAEVEALQVQVRGLAHEKEALRSKLVVSEQSGRELDGLLKRALKAGHELSAAVDAYKATRPVFIGRNDPCGCGSGRKFKECNRLPTCGGAPA